jgi:tetratricopeptide (TPR) repeat protein
MTPALRRFLLSCSFVLLASTAFAESARELKAQGDAAFTARRYSEAIAAYEKAYAAGHDAAVLYNKARAHEALEQFPEALATIEQFDKEAPAQVRAKVTGLSTLIADIRRRVATLVITCNVPGARVTVRDVPVGETSAQALRVQVNSGKVRVVVEKEGHASFVQDLNLPGESSTTVTAILEGKADTSLVKITSTPPRAAVSIDGRAVGATPIEIDLSPRSHRLEAERDGYDKLTTTVVIEAGKSRTVDLTLAESSSVLGKWWFWTGVGAAVVTGAVVVVLATREGDAPAGTIQPGTVSAPLLTWGR